MAFKPRDIFYVFDSAVPYKKLTLYPVKMKDYYTFAFLSQCLMLEKTADPDPIKTIAMTYLEYLFYKSDDENKLIYLMDGLLRMVLGKQPDEKFEIKYRVGKNNRPEIEIEGEVYDSDDFMQLREIISEQNGLELPNEKIQKTVRDKMEEARRYKEKLRGNKMASLEDQMLALSIYSGWDLDKIYSLTIRKFKRALMRANHMLYQQVFLQAKYGGMVTFKDESFINGWLADIDDEDKYGDVTMNLEDLQSKANFESAKK